MDNEKPTSIGDLLKEWAKAAETPADYVFDPKTPIKPRREPTVYNIDTTKKPLTEYWKKLALDFRADRDLLRKQLNEHGARYRQTINNLIAYRKDFYERFTKENDALRKENEDLKGAIQYYEEERISDDLFGTQEDTPPESFTSGFVDIRKPTKAEWLEWNAIKHGGDWYVPNTVAIVAPPDMPDYKAIIDGLKSDIAELREENEELRKAIKENNEAHYETHKKLTEAGKEQEHMKERNDNLSAEWSRTIDLALRYEEKLVAINKQYPGILGDEELRDLMTHPE